MLPWFALKYFLIGWKYIPSVEHISKADLQKANFKAGNVVLSLIDPHELIFLDSNRYENYKNKIQLIVNIKKQVLFS